jgi:adenylate cyclase
LASERVERRLTAIVAADVAGYSRLMGADEEGTLAQLKAHRRDLVDPKIGEHRGRIVKTTGDGMLVEFVSVVDALRCAVEVQLGMAARNAEAPQDRQIEFRIGINIGDIIIDGGDIYGDGVNVAARLERVAEPGGICVSGRVLEDTQGRLDLTFEDAGEQQLKNILRPVRVYRVRPNAVRAPPQPVLALPDKPSIAVLPFQNMSGDAEQEYFADGMVEEIITALSRIRWLFVIARNSSFTYKGQAVDVKRVARELGVRYVLEGSVRKAGGRVRIAGQLIDAASGAHLWADHFDGSLEDIFELQDKVAVSVAGVIEPALRDAELQRSILRPPTDLTAYDLYLRGRAELLPSDKEGLARGLHLLEQALGRDPGYGPALAHAAFCQMMLHLGGWMDAAQARRDGVGLARRALRVAGDDPGILAYAAYVLGYFGEDLPAALAMIERALELNPSFAQGWRWSGWLRLWAGRPDLAIQHFETSMRLNPRESRAGFHQGIGVAHFFLRQFEEARAMLLRSLQEKPGWVPTHRFLASCCAQMGRLDEAREVIQALRNMTSVLIPTATHWRDPQLRELYLEGLRLAAGELTSPRQPNGTKDRADQLPEDRQGARIEDPATAAPPRR